MSDIAASEPVVDPVEGGQVDGGEQPAAETDPTPEIQVWDEFDNYADQYVTITVDGEQVPVRLAELRDGYQRHEDYTRKTQSLAEQRKELERAEQLYRALDQDPERTIRALQATLLGDEPPADEPDPEDEFLSDEEKQIKALQRQVDDLVQQRQFEEISKAFDAELEGLVNQFKLDDAGRQELIDFAVERNYPNFTDAYARLRLERASVEDAARAAEESRRTAAKQQAATVAGGSARSTVGSQPSITPRAGQSVRESFQQAKAQLEAARR